MTDLHHIDQLKTQLEYEKSRYKELSLKVGEYIKAQSDWKKYKRSDLFHKKCNLEAEITILINPSAAKQTVLEWQGQ